MNLYLINGLVYADVGQECLLFIGSKHEVETWSNDYLTAHVHAAVCEARDAINNPSYEWLGLQSKKPS